MLVIMDEPVYLPRPPRLVLSSPQKEPAQQKLPWAHKYTEEVANRVCDEVAGGRTLQRIALEEEWAPSIRTLQYWMNEHADFKEAYKFAVQLRADGMAQQILDVAYDATWDPENKRIIIDAHKLIDH